MRPVAFLGSALVSLQLAAELADAASLINHAQEDAWTETASWLQENGAVLHPRLHANMTWHGGNHIRGVVTETELGPGEVLLRIPEKLWFSEEHFPELVQAKLPEIPECKLEPMDLKFLKMGVAVARESKRKADSFFHPYLKTLPSFNDFRTFFPRLMENSVVVDFWALPLVKTVLFQQERDAKARVCFGSWQASAEGSAANISGIAWSDVSAGLLQFRTRAYHVGLNRPALIPGSDLINTERAGTQNADWSTANRAFALTTGKDAKITAGSELYESYCPECDNSKMLLVWGVYLEDNPSPISQEERDHLNCSEVQQGASKTLLEVALPMLDLESSTDAARVWTAPRCKPSSLASAGEQAPLICNLARLAYEACAREWGVLAGRPSRSANIATKLEPKAQPLLAVSRTR